MPVKGKVVGKSDFISLFIFSYIAYIYTVKWLVISYRGVLWTGQTSEMEFFVKIVKGFKPLTIFEKSSVSVFVLF